MFNIESYLAKFKTVGSGDVLLREKVAELIQKVCGVELNRKSLKLKDATLFVNAHAVHKMEIILRKAELLAEIKKTLPDARVFDIR